MPANDAGGGLAGVHAGVYGDSVGDDQTEGVMPTGSGHTHRNRTPQGAMPIGALII